MQQQRDIKAVVKQFCFYHLADIRAVFEAYFREIAV